MLLKLYDLKNMGLAFLDATGDDSLLPKPYYTPEEFSNPGVTAKPFIIRA